ASYSLRHGEAVAIGMVAEADLAVRCCGFSDAGRNQLVQLLVSFGLPAKTSVAAREVHSRIALDKKNRADKVRFALPREFGRMTWLESPPQDDVLAAISRVCPA
ncbi:MAG TPA: 3-dehydroquinate synthase, partial [Phycisphaerae bacterium]|nr:3-dehydroquinate synthase [Phycisphaerae bacterium]